MQFHENGFQPGDPSISDPRQRVKAPPLKQPLPEQADVLIVGCGPAGLMLAAYLSQMSDLSVCIVDQKDDRLLVGQADGIACRTMELFQTFGFAEEVEREAYGVNEAVFWRPGSTASSVEDAFTMSKTTCRSSPTSSLTKRVCMITSYESWSRG